MTSHTKALFDAALALPEADRALLADRLWESLSLDEKLTTDDQLFADDHLCPWVAHESVSFSAAALNAASARSQNLSRYFLIASMPRGSIR